MYELVKQKSWGMRIFIGILILFFITQILKLILKDPPVNIHKELVTFANEINANAPILLDSLTRLDNINAFKGNVLEYNYTILKTDGKDVDTTQFVKLAKEELLSDLKGNPKFAYFRTNNIEVRANYVDEKGHEICKIIIEPREYK
jgi:hypothetical protein